VNQLDRFVLEGLDGNDSKKRRVGWERNHIGQEGLSIIAEGATEAEYWRPEKLFSEQRLEDVS
jgi:hypothetical protein